MTFTTKEDLYSMHDLVTTDQGDARVVSAYNNLFAGKGSRQDADLVLVDLLQFSRYYTTASLELPADQVKALDQRRAVGERVMEALMRGDFDVRGLHRAVASTEATDLTVDAERAQLQFTNGTTTEED